MKVGILSSDKLLDIIKVNALVWLVVHRQTTTTEEVQRKYFTLKQNSIIIIILV
jgi:hypothetical protein